MLGTLLNDRYRITRLVGQGGMGQVYAAEDVGSGEVVAIKLLSEIHSRHKDQVLRFRREFRSLSRLRHPHVVSVYESGEDGGRLYYVMEYVEGGGLLDHVRQANASRDRQAVLFLQLLIQTCSALAYIHANRIVHRDLKPSNLMVASGHLVKVMDFGLIRDLDYSQAITASGAAVGTIDYMAPEQAKGAAVDPRTDLYALGVMIYEFFAGKKPFESRNPIETLLLHIREEPVSPRVHAPWIPAPIEGLILRLLQKNPFHRVQTADDLKQELIAILREELGESVAASPGGATALLEPEPHGQLFVPDLIGAETAMEKLAATLTSDSRSAPPVVALAAPQGMGKTRILRDFLERSSFTKVQVYFVACEGAQGPPYQAWSALFGQMAPLLLDHREALSLELGDRLTVLKSLFPPGAAETLTAGLVALPSLDPEGERRRLFDSVVGLFSTLTNYLPLSLVFDDVDQMDRSGFELIVHFARFLANPPDTDSFSPKRYHRLTLGIAFQDEGGDRKSPLGSFIRELQRQGSVEVIRLEPLTAEQCQTFVQSACGTTELPAGLVQHMTTESDGNPLFLDILLQHAFQSGALYREGGHWRWHHMGPRKGVVPDHIREVLQRRLDPLEDENLHLFRIAAVLGRRFDFESLRHLAKVSEDDLLDWVDLTVKERLLREVTGTKGEVFEFQYTKLHDLCYQENSPEDLIRLHTAAGEILEKHGSEDNPSTILRVAFHYDGRRKDERAFRAFMSAARTSMTSHAAETALHYLGRAKEIGIDTLGAPNPLRPALLEAFNLEGTVCFYAGKYSQAEEAWTGLAESGALWQAPFQAAEGRYQLARLAYYRGDWDPALERAAVARKQFEALGSQAGVAKLLALEGCIREDRSEFPEALAALNASLECFRSLADAGGEAASLSALGNLLVGMGRAAEAFPHLDRSLQLRRTLNDAYGIAGSLINLGSLYIILGKYQEALEAFGEANTLCRSIGFCLGIARTTLSLGNAAFKLGDYATALHQFREAVVLARDLDDKVLLCQALGNQGETHRVTGALIKARRCYTEALEISQALKLPENIARNSGGLGATAFVQGCYLEAHTRFQDAVHYFASIGQPVDLLYARYYLGEVALAMGDSLPESSPPRALAKEARELGKPSLALACLTLEARAALNQGDGTKGRALLEETLADALENGSSRGMVPVLLAWIEYHLGHQEYAEALAKARDTEFRAEAWKNPYYSVCGLLYGAEAALALGEAGEAQMQLSKAAALVTDLDSREFEWRQRVLAGQQQLLQGDRREAIDACLNALEILEEQKNQFPSIEAQQRFWAVPSRRRLLDLLQQAGELGLG